MVYEEVAREAIECPEGRDPVEFSLMRAGFTNRDVLLAGMSDATKQQIAESPDANVVRDIVRRHHEENKLG